MNNETMIAVLNGAKEILFERGWDKRLGTNETSPTCIMGAIYRAAGYTSAYAGSYAVGEAFATVLPIHDAFKDAVGMEPVHFNDEHGRQFDEILDAIDTTIKYLEGQ